MLRLTPFVSAPLVALVAACAPTSKHIPTVTIVTGVDLSRYSQRGFLFSPDAYTGPHEAVGLVSVRRYAEAPWEVPNQREALPHWEFGHVSTQEALDSMYARAVSLGADALVKMEIRSVEQPAQPGRPAIPGVEVSGFAIRRSSAR